MGYGYIATCCGDTIQVFNNVGTWLYNIPSSSANTYGLAIDNNGELYASELGVGVVGYILGPSGAVSDYVWTGQGSFYNPYGVKIDANENLVVADGNGNRVWNVSWDDDTVLNYTTGGPTVNPIDVALDNSGNLYVATEYEIAEYNSQYQYVNSFNGTNWNQSLGSWIYGVGVDSVGNLYISDTKNGRIVIASNQGQYLGEIDGFGFPAHLVLDSANDLFIADQEGDCAVNEFTSNLGLIPIETFTPTYTGGNPDTPTFTLTPPPPPNPTPTFTYTFSPTLTMTPTGNTQFIYSNGSFYSWQGSMTSAGCPMSIWDNDCDPKEYRYLSNIPSILGNGSLTGIFYPEDFCAFCGYPPLGLFSICTATAEDYSAFYASGHLQFDVELSDPVTLISLSNVYLIGLDGQISVYNSGGVSLDVSAYSTDSFTHVSVPISSIYTTNVTQYQTTQYPFAIIYRSSMTGLCASNASPGPFYLNNIEWTSN